MNRRNKLMITTFACFVTLMIIGSSFMTPNPTLVGPKFNPFSYADAASSSNWWNASYNYRIDIDITEPGLRDRVNETHIVYLAFEDGSCYNDSLRALFFNGADWTELPLTTWNMTWHSSGYLAGASLTFPVNVSQSSTETYYVYYANVNVGSADYNYYPFE
ncbi:MAG: hypothetical protein ACW976_05850, partial [Candidatus Ranarchaeia archaeon]